MPEIVACSTNESFIILRSIGIEVYFDDNILNVEEKLAHYANSGAKIIIYDACTQNYVQTLLDKYEDQMYPIFLKLPSGKKNEDTLLEIKTLIEKSIGISIL
ncbi:V-type ATP synthase subunit F [Acholeplasma granularum]|uniref:V-type ATP synthase subunit F n=1 Tax=Acholeplasma granularum TaxID=264635 RepID=UPI00047237DF|nr:V-type ATP synthase subunit F [Acholeplasma granularum]